MKYSLTILAMFFGISAFSQKSDTLIRYFNSSFQPVNRNIAAYNGKVYQDNKGWNARIFNDSGKLVLTGTFKDRNLNVKNGFFTWYYPNGNLLTAGQITDDIQTGIWQSWHPGGQKKDSVLFINGVKSGPAWSWHENGQPKFIGGFLNGMASGDWTWFYPNGNPSTKEKYDKGKLSSLECFDENGKFTGINCPIETPPTIKGVYGGINKFIMDSLLFPKEALQRNITGLVEVVFTITRDGKMENIRFESTPSKILSDEVLRVLMLVPGWYPAVEHNQKVDYPIRLRIPFYRDEDGE